MDNVNFGYCICHFNTGWKESVESGKEEYKKLEYESTEK